MKKAAYIILGIILLSVSVVYVRQAREKKIHQLASDSFAHLDEGDRALSMDEYDKAIIEYKLAMKYPHCVDAAIDRIEIALILKAQKKYSENNKPHTKDDVIVLQIADYLASGKQDEAYHLLQDIEDELLRANIRKFYFSEKPVDQTE